MIPLIPTAAQSILGLGQLIGGLGKRLKRPSMPVPEGVKESTTLARMLKDKLRPGRTVAEDAIKGASSTALTNLKKTAGSASDVMAGLSAIQGSENKALQEQDLLDEQYQENANVNLMGQLNNLGQWQQRAWDWNKGQKYEEEAATKSALTEGGIQNIIGAGNTAIGMDMLSGGELFKRLNGMFGKKQTVSPDWANAIMKLGGQEVANNELYKLGKLPIFRKKPLQM